MKKIDREQWTAKTLRLNSDHTLRVGDEVIDIEGNKGIVVKIIPGTSDEDHGTVYVWHLNEQDGSDKCEHYVEFSWKTHLRI